ncbi:MAG: LamG domain-containing protein, partial [Spirochaetia bacterium]|nr:LamG domain-containing protein [Spirochaetia bacterium]
MNIKKFWVNATLAAVFFAPLAAGDNTLAEWKFDRRENNAVSEITGKYPGTIRGNIDALRIENGFSGKAFFFDAGKFYIEIPHVEALSLKNDFTIEAIIKPEEVVGYHTILWKGRRSVKPEAVGYYFNIRDGKLDFKAKKEDGTWFGWLTSEAAIEKGKWVHVAATFKDGNAELFVNGEKKSSTGGGAGVPNELLQNDFPLVIGNGEAGGGAPDYHFTGLIDTIRIARGAEFDRSPRRFSLFALTLIESRLSETGAALTQKSDRAAALKSGLQNAKSRLKPAQANEMTTALSEIDSAIRDIEKGTTELRTALNKNLSGLAVPGFSGLGASGHSSELREKLHAAIEQIRGSRGTSSSQSGEGIPQTLFALDAEYSALAVKNLDLMEARLKKTESRFLEALYFDGGTSFLAFAVPASAVLVKKTGILRELGVLTNGARLRMARGESESLLAVLVGHPDKDGIENISVKVADPGGPILEWAPVKTVDTSKSIVPLEEKGPVFDVIMDGE